MTRSVNSTSRSVPPAPRAIKTSARPSLPAPRDPSSLDASAVERVVALAEQFRAGGLSGVTVKEELAALPAPGAR